MKKIISNYLTISWFTAVICKNEAIWSFRVNSRWPSSGNCMAYDQPSYAGSAGSWWDGARQLQARHRWSAHKNLTTVMESVIKTLHYCNVTWLWWLLKSLVIQLFFNSLFRLTTKKTSNFHYIGDSTCDPWISFTKVQWCGQVSISWHHI